MDAAESRQARRAGASMRKFAAFLLLVACKTAAAAGETDAALADVAADSAVDVAAVDVAAEVSASGWQATLTTSSKVPLQYSQGIARLPGGWAFSAKSGLWRTDDAFTELVAVVPPLPATLADAEGYGHVGDIDYADGKLFAALEQGDSNVGKQAVAWFDPKTLEYQGHVYLPQHENPCLCIDEQTLIAYTPDRYHGDSVQMYDVKANWKPLGTLKFSRKLDAMQGIDVQNGALWFSCDDPVHGLYRVDLKTGMVTQIGTIGRLEESGLQPEVEGIDAADGLLRTLTDNPLNATSWVDEWKVTGP